MPQTLLKSMHFKITASPQVGRVLIESRVAPLSLQARRERIREFQTNLSTALASATDFLFTGDVEITFTWFISDRERYQMHTATDLDNVLKPLIDATTGPNGVMIDDNQIQSIRASWMTPGSSDTIFTLEMQTILMEDLVKRAGTAFVAFRSDTSYILPGEARSNWDSFIKAYKSLLDAKRILMDQGFAEDTLRGIAPITRPWHTQRLRMQGFPVRHIDEFPWLIK